MALGQSLWMPNLWMPNKNFCFDLSHRRSTTVSLETRNPFTSTKDWNYDRTISQWYYSNFYHFHARNYVFKELKEIFTIRTIVVFGEKWHFLSNTNVLSLLLLSRGGTLGNFWVGMWRWDPEIREQYFIVHVETAKKHYWTLECPF